MKTFLRPCLIFLQLIIALGIMSTSVSADDIRFKEYPVQYVWNSPRYFYPAMKLSVSEQKSNKKVRRGRGPASTIPRDDISPAPVKEEIWLSNVWVEDRAGTMTRMKNEMARWDRLEQYRAAWDIESSGQYDTPDMEDKQRWFNKMLLKYADKRLTGELKDAAEGSTLQKIRNVKTALKPSSTASISENVKLKFKAKVMRMKAYMRVVNPWVESETEFAINGRVTSRFKKEFKDLGVNTNLEYRLHDNDYTASLSKPLGYNVTAVVSSTSAVNEMAFAKNADSTFQLQYYTSF